jgi:hypothetical protein
VPSLRVLYAMTKLAEEVALGRKEGS